MKTKLIPKLSISIEFFYFDQAWLGRKNAKYQEFFDSNLTLGKIIEEAEVNIKRALAQDETVIEHFEISNVQVFIQAPNMNEFTDRN